MDCSVPPLQCFGIDYDDPAVCSGPGDCIGQDYCECESGYGGSNCSAYACYGYVMSDPEVCSGHGTCVASDSCSCEAGWGGADCSEALQCYGIDYDDPAVCSERGECVEQDTCVCDESWWVGDECELCKYDLLGDFNEDCRADLQDLAQFALVWLTDCVEDPGNAECVLP